jgi:hypothetical protein
MLRIHGILAIGSLSYLTGYFKLIILIHLI